VTGAGSVDAYDVHGDTVVVSYANLGAAAQLFKFKRDLNQAIDVTKPRN